jgi:hypothetical protein
MVTKREFLAGSAAVVAAGAGLRLRSADLPERFDVVVYNGLFKEAREFAAAQAANGALALALDGDAGVLWYGTLQQLVRGGRRRLAGMGTHTDFFIFETLGRDERLKMSQACRHECAGPVLAAGPRLVSWRLT